MAGRGLVVQVCRSALDRAVWFTYAAAEPGVESSLNLSDFEHPGRLRAVQRFAAERYAQGQTTRWVRVDDDTYELDVKP